MHSRAETPCVLSGTKPQVNGLYRAGLHGCAWS